MSTVVEYSHNNSGGSWWLKDEDWRALEDAGWKVEWEADGDDPFLRSMMKNGRFLGALATRATRSGLSAADAIEEFERVTGQDAAALGCFTCCGPPHSFTVTEEDGTKRYISPEAPVSGSLDI